MFAGLFAVFVGGSGVLFGHIWIAVIVMMGCLAMMMGGRFVFGGCVLMMFRRLMSFLFLHDYSSKLKMTGQHAGKLLTGAAAI